MQNPFTTTFSKAPEYTYISTDEAQEIIENFSYDRPTESVYKITGVRGSGKTVSLSKVEEELSGPDYQEKGWLVYRLTPSRDIVQQFAAKLYKEPFIKGKKKNTNISINAQVLGTGGGVGVGRSEADEFFDIGAEIDDMLEEAQKNHKKILVGIDEVSKTKEMIVFASEFGKWLRADYPVYMVCTGLYKNIQELSNVKNLTFFRRAVTKKTSPLNMIKMSQIYKDKLGVDIDQAKTLAGITKGYAYAFQELGTMYFRKKEEEDLDEILTKLKAELFAYSYEKIWEELSEGDRNLVKCILDKDEYKRAEVLEKMGSAANNYSIYRDRLKKKGVIETRQGYLSLALPYFNEYVKEYCM